VFKFATSVDKFVIDAFILFILKLRFFILFIVKPLFGIIKVFIERLLKEAILVSIEIF